MQNALRNQEIQTEFKSKNYGKKTTCKDGEVIKNVTKKNVFPLK
jgi:hypothetical protein